MFLPIRCFKINKLVSITHDLGTFQTVVLLWVLGKYIWVEALQEKIFLFLIALWFSLQELWYLFFLYVWGPDVRHKSLTQQ